MKKKITIEDLARMVSGGFTEIEKKVEQSRIEVEKKVEQSRIETQDGLRAVNRRIDLLREDLSDLPDIREELKDHDERLTHVERKVGLPK